MPLTSGKLCSQIGSWITTGTRSQRCSIAVSHTSSDGAGTKSESTKTNVPGVTARRCSARCVERALEPVASGPPYSDDQSRSSLELDQLPLALRLTPVRVPVGVVEVADEAAGGARTREDELDDVAHRLRLVEPWQRRAKYDICGRRSQTITTLGASSAKRSRTTNSSLPFAVESRADAAQSMESMSSPGRYGREPATSVPEPRRRLRIVPNEMPMTRATRERAGT